MTITSMNIHFHGTNTSPACHSDGVVHAIVNSGKTFKYVLDFPKDEPPGLYWYHPHVHGISAHALQGGASGAILVEGIEKLQPAVLGLKERLLVLRDQNLIDTSGSPPSWDISLNYVPIIYPSYVPATLHMQHGVKELWRVVNAAADTIMELVLKYDGVPQPMVLVGLDGVPIGSQDGTRRGKLLVEKSIRLPPASRAEFIVAAPGYHVKVASLVTNHIAAGPFADIAPLRPLARIVADDKPDALRVIPAVAGPAGPQRFEGLAAAVVTAKRTLYFSERQSTFSKGPPGSEGPPGPDGAELPGWGESGLRFFITVLGQTPTPFNPLAPPAIVTDQGAVEDWTIENHSGENHEFHMHQIHFLILARNGVPVPPSEQQFRDMVEVPYWDGKGPLPSVTVRMDFRGATVGDFVYHCHILDHEDAGMMAIIRVRPPKPAL
jgi:FtsP/CotA-like multicopper oxidase with cupredoxin domain